MLYSHKTAIYGSLDVINTHVHWWNYDGIVAVLRPTKMKHKKTTQYKLKFNNPKSPPEIKQMLAYSTKKKKKKKKKEKKKKKKKSRKLFAASVSNQERCKYWSNQLKFAK